MKQRQYEDVSIGSEEAYDCILLPVSTDLEKKISAKAMEWELTIQEAIIRMLREHIAKLEEKRE